MRPAVLILAAILVPAAASAGAELVLEDGQVLQGVDLERKDDVYILRLSTGGMLTLPAALVKEWRLTAEGEPEPEQPVETEEPPGETEEPATPATPPRRGEQLEAFGKPPARFRNSIINPTWTPESDWDDDPELNNFNPARWYRSPLDPTWRPTSAFADSVDVWRSSRATWRRSIVDTTWVPTDGFGAELISLVPEEPYVPAVTFTPEP